MAFVKVLCALALMGFASARQINVSKVNLTALQAPNSFLGEDWWCDELGDFAKFPHPLWCDWFLMCWEGVIVEMDCENGEIFDDTDWTCLPADQAVCVRDEVEPDVDSECPPPGSNDVVFLPSELCEQFYICINGQPIQLNCRPGQHWNIEGEFCDDPENAGCEEDAGTPPGKIPDCPLGFNGQLPHPHNCNWFIHCNNGNRSIQQCRHLHHFDMERRECLFHSIARCIKQARL